MFDMVCFTAQNYSLAEEDLKTMRVFQKKKEKRKEKGTAGSADQTKCALCVAHRVAFKGAYWVRW